MNETLRDNFVDQRVLAQSSTNRIQQLGSLNGFHEYLLDAEIKGANALREVGISSDEYYANPGILFPQRFSDLSARNVGQFDVEDREIVFSTGRQIQGLEASRDRIDVESLPMRMALKMEVRDSSSSTNRMFPRTYCS